MPRCDRCPAAAAFRFLHPGTGHELTLCGHHARRHRPRLRAEGWHTYRLVEATASA